MVGCLYSCARLPLYTCLCIHRYTHVHTHRSNCEAEQHHGAGALSWQARSTWDCTMMTCQRLRRTSSSCALARRASDTRVHSWCERGKEGVVGWCVREGRRAWRAAALRGREGEGGRRLVCVREGRREREGGVGRLKRLPHPHLIDHGNLCLYC